MNKGSSYLLLSGLFGNKVKFLTVFHLSHYVYILKEKKNLCKLIYSHMLCSFFFFFYPIAISNTKNAYDDLTCKKLLPKDKMPGNDIHYIHKFTNKMNAR